MEKIYNLPLSIALKFGSGEVVTSVLQKFFNHFFLQVTLSESLESSLCANPLENKIAKRQKIKESFSPFTYQ